MLVVAVPTLTAPAGVLATTGEVVACAVAALTGAAGTAAAGAPAAGAAVAGEAAGAAGIGATGVTAVTGAAAGAGATALIVWPVKIDARVGEDPACWPSAPCACEVAVDIP